MCRELFGKVCEILRDTASRFNCTFHAKWHYQYVRGCVKNFELRLYARSSITPSYVIADYLASRLRELGLGAYRRPKDTFVTVRRGKEELAVVLYKLGYMRDLLPPELPEKVRKRVLGALREVEGRIKIVELPEHEVENYLSKLVQEVNDRYRRLVEKLKDEKQALRKVQEEYEQYIKLTLSVEEIRRRIAENIDYAVWLTISDGITSIIVDNNVDTLQYGTTRHELLAIVLKAYGFMKLTITGRDNKTGKPHLVATVNNYIAKEILGREVPEIDEIVHRVRHVLLAAKSILANYLENVLGVTLHTSTKVSDVNDLLRRLYTNGKLTTSTLVNMARERSYIIAEQVGDPIKALAGLIDGDGFLEKRREGDYGVGIALAPYTVKGFAVLMLIADLERRGLIVINGFHEKGLGLRVWLSPQTRSKLTQCMKHPLRLERARTLSERVTTMIVKATCVDLRAAMYAVQEALRIARLYGVEIRGEWKIRRERGRRTLVLFVRLTKGSTNVKLIDVAKEIAEAMRRYGIGARQYPKSAIIEVKKGKIEVAYILHQLGILSELVPKEADGQLLKVILARLEELRGLFVKENSTKNTQS